MTKIQKIVLVILPLLALAIFSGFKYYTNWQEIKKYNFEVMSDKGVVKLSDFRGQKTLVYFGYGLCPDICPTTLAAMGDALAMLSPSELNSTKAVFITVDPERDTPQKLGEFARYFHPSIIGSATNLDDTQKYASNYGVKYQKIPQPNSSIGYSVAHSADLYVIGEDGKLESVLPFGVTPQEIATAIRK